MDFNKLIKDKILYFDGAMGSMLQKRVLKIGQLPENLNIENPEVIKDIHREYLLAGSDFISTNTFGAFNFKFDNLEQIIKTGILNAKDVIKDFGPDKYVAFDIGSTGKLIEPLGDTTFDQCYEIYKESFQIAQKYNPDVILIETMGDIYEAKIAILAAKENTNLPIICTMTFDEKGLSLTGSDVKIMASVFEGLGVDCIGINCGLGPKKIKTLFDELIKYTSMPILIQANAGLPKTENSVTVYDVDSEEFSEDMIHFAKNGAFILGGCCGTTPEYIKKTVQKTKDIKYNKPSKKDITIVTSNSKSVIIDKKPVIVGERINPTGKKAFKEALLSGNLTYALDEAVKQADNGADILDVNVGLPGIDEEDMMVKTIKLIQASVDLPLQIDSSTPEVLERALRIYNGKPLVNSVNGKENVLKKVLPLIKKYGGVVVALTLDEDGIPPKAEKRYEIAKKVIQRASEYGIDKKNVVADTLTLTVSAQQEEAMETVKALRLIRDNLGIKTILGVSNISFGLPQRSLINTTFLTMALYNGLNLCIINPMMKAMTDVISAFNALTSIDKGCSEYINIHSESIKENTEVKKDDTNLIDLIVKGIKEKTYSFTKELLKSKTPLDIVNEYIVPALDTVGKGYETGKMFLPQLIMSAECAKNSFNAINEYLKQTGSENESKDTVIVATVEGDIHDIGKNIVKALLDNYGFNVIDLGKDVPIDTVVEAVIENDAKLLGLSALMTTTVVNMEKTIIQVRKKAPECKIMVGGAVLNYEYAMEIGADFYGKDALASVKYAKEVFGREE